ncbi:DUF2956 domain-containing protein [Paraglaciecola sp.]|uniref:DUF2956 domain-containing protein n=1 Tax=Paraglaciecola sp. TaxID=1920173 RepID=UPI003266D776
MKNKVSPELEAQALKIAKSRQKQGQTKEQTKLIAQGIEKGIAEYKKQQNKRLRELDKQRKHTLKQVNQTPSDVTEEAIPEPKSNMLPWVLLGASWLGFISFILFV